MDKKLYTKIKTDEGIVKIPQDDIELQKVVSLIYSMDIEIDQLKAQIEKMKCRENCGNAFEISNNTSCPLYDFQNVRCPCDKWEMMK